MARIYVNTRVCVYNRAVSRARIYATLLYCVEERRSGGRTGGRTYLCTSVRLFVCIDVRLAAVSSRFDPIRSEPRAWMLCSSLSFEKGEKILGSLR